MQRILRSLIYQDTAEKAATTANYDHVNIDRLFSLQDRERAVLEFLLDFQATSGEAPSHRVVYEHFETLNASAECSLVEELGGKALREGASFGQTFEEVVEKQGRCALKAVFQEAAEIATEGLEVQKGITVQGIGPAVAHVFTSLKAPPPKSGATLAPDMRESAQGLRDEYQRRADNPAQAFGVQSGFRALDKLTGGYAPGGLVIHAGFAAHLKSTFLLNQCVNAVTRGWDPIIFSDEMLARDLMLMVVAIHSANPQFAAQWAPLNAFKVLKGRLSDEEKEVFREVQDHLLNTKTHGSLRVYDSGTFSSFGSIAQLTVREHAKKPVDLIWIDYLTRLPLDVKYLRRGIDHTTGVNLTIQEAKHFAMGFDGGKALPVCTAFQINREGLRRGTEAKGVLDARHLGQYNAAEKEADLITYSWFGPEEEAASEVKIGMIKNRWGPKLAEPVDMFYHTESRLIHEMGGQVIQGGTVGVEIEDV